MAHQLHYASRRSLIVGSSEHSHTHKHTYTYIHIHVYIATQFTPSSTITAK